MMGLLMTTMEDFQVGIDQGWERDEDKGVVHVVGWVVEVSNMITMMIMMTVVCKEVAAVIKPIVGQKDQEVLGMIG